MKMEVESNVLSDMLHMLYTLLPYIEDLKDDKSFKKGAMASLVKELWQVIQKAEKAGVK